MAIKQESAKARKDSLRLIKKLQRETLKIYIASTDAIALEVAKLKTVGKGAKYQLTIASKEALIESLKKETVILRKQISALSTAGITKGVDLNAGRYGKYTEKYLLNVNHLDNKILADTFAKVNSDLVAAQLAKTYGDGLTYSKRIWNSSKQFEKTIRNVIAEGIARNRDILTISKDLNAYVRTNKKTLAKRYANIDQSPLRPGETLAEWNTRVSTFKTRIPTDIEYNSLRLVRSNVQGAIQDSNITCSSYTPSVEGFDWTLSPAHAVYSICEDIEAGNPWTYETFDWGTPPHPNCLSYTTFKEKPQGELDKDLKAWSNNPTAPGTEYLQDWKEKYYNPMVRGDSTNYFGLLVARANKGT